MALFGLSPLFLSFLASNFFSNPETGLDVTRFIKFHAITAGTIHLVGAFTLRPPLVSESDSTPPPDDSEHTSDPNTALDERTPLIPSKPLSDVELQVTPVSDSASALDLLRDRNFWILFLSSLIILGSVSPSLSLHLV